MWSTDRKLGTGHLGYSKTRLDGAMRVEVLPHFQPNSISPDKDQDSFTHILEDNGSQSLNQQLVKNGFTGSFSMYTHPTS